MISKKRWEKEKHQLLERAGMLNFLDSKTILQQLDQTLYDQYKLTNDRAIENEYLNFKADESFHIKTPPLDRQDTDPLQAWFPKRYYISLDEILETVYHHSHYQPSSIGNKLTHQRLPHTLPY